MKNGIIVFICIAFSIFVSNAQSTKINNLEIYKDSSKYLIGKNKIFNITYKLQNNGNEPIWLWLEKDDVSDSTDSFLIKRYFLKINEGIGMSLYSIGMDGNFGDFIPDIYYTFLKCILPNKYFTIQIASQDTVSDATKQNVFSYLKNHVILYNEKDLLKYIPTLNKIDKFIFFKDEFISIKLDMLMNIQR